MISAILKKFSGRHYKKYLRKCQPIIERINALEIDYQSLTEEQVAAKTVEFMQRHKEGESLDDLLPEAFAQRLRVISYMAKLPGESVKDRALLTVDHQPGAQWPLYYYELE